MLDYTKFSLVTLIDGIKWFDLPFRLKEILGRINSQSKSYKVYTATLTQTGEDAPIAVELENDLGEITWSRLGEGNYLAESLELFTENKTFLISGTIPFINNPAISFTRVDEGSIGLQISVNDTQADGLLTEFSVEIKVYN